ncbi:MAG: DUF4329 domain-containing protein [Acidobacteria bacterium]|nr:DUF4329 domain-containing protein [Acidobacteriota bacterium]
MSDPTVLGALEQAWIDSNPDDPANRHEEGGWIYMDLATGELAVQRARAGGAGVLNLNTPVIVAGSVVVGTFHTHPNPKAEGWNPGPSTSDEISAKLLGVPCLIRAEDGIHTTGPDSRRHGLGGGPGFPP